MQQETVTYSHRKVVNLCVVYEITNFHDIDNYPTVANALFGAATLTKNTDIGKFKYYGYGIGFDGKGFFLTFFWRNWNECNNFRSRYELIN